MRFLLVDDTIQDMIGLRWYIQTYLAGSHQIEYTTNMTDAITKLHSFEPEIILLNLDLLPDIYDASIYEPLQRANCHIFTLSSDTLYKTAQKAIQIHAKALWTKPLDLEKFLKKITQLSPIQRIKSSDSSFYFNLFQQDGITEKVFTLIEPEEDNNIPVIFQWLNESIAFQHAEIYPLSSTIIVLLPKANYEKDARMIATHCPFIVNVCIVDEELTIQQSYKRAKNRLQQRFYEGYGHVLHSSKTIEYIPFDPLLSPSQQSEIISCLEKGNIEQFERFLQPLKSNFFDQGDVRVHLTSILAQIRRFMLNQHLDEKEKIELHYFHVYHLIIEHPILFHILESLVELTETLMQMVQFAKINGSKGYVVRAKDYINTYYSNPELSLKVIAKEIGINANYLSTLFKKETQLSFRTMLQQIRIQKSMELLLNTTKPIVEIAHACGFDDANYFSKCFKRQVGITPKEFRVEEN